MGSSLADLIAKSKQKQAEQAQPNVPAAPASQAVTVPAISNNPALDAANSALLNAPLTQEEHALIAKQETPEQFNNPEQVEALDTDNKLGLEQALANIKQAVDGVLPNPEAGPQALRTVLTMLKADPGVAEWMHPEDIGAMVTLLKKSKGVMIVEKTEKKTRAAKKQADISETVDFLDSLGLGNLEI
jgi:hypothetical protein